MRQEEFDFDPDSPGYVGRSKAHCSKHNLRDVHDLIDAVQQYYLVEDDSQRVPAYRLFSAARILRAAADRLENELKKRQEEKMRQLRELRLALIDQSRTDYYIPSSQEVQDVIRRRNEPLPWEV